VARVLSTALVLVLLAATAVAFALTESAKLELSPIYGTQPDLTFSPDSKVQRKKLAHIHFRVRRQERVDVWIADKHDDKVTDLITKRTVRPRQLLQPVWDGFTPQGLAAPDGTYHPVVKLERSHRTIVIPSDIVLDTKPPTITAKPATKYPIISPDGDGRSDVFSFPYSIDERAQAILLLRGKQITLMRFARPTGTLVWNGKRHGRSLPPGRYVLGVAARDEAGNQSKGTPVAIAQIRYVALARKRVVVRPGGKFAIRVSTDARTVDWRLHGRSGTLPRGTLHLRAPKSVGVYRLFVTVANHTAVCSVVVA
jgi:hypothetical protein